MPVAVSRRPSAPRPPGTSSSSARLASRPATNWIASSMALLMATRAGMATTRSSGPTGVRFPVRTSSRLLKAGTSMTVTSRSKSNPSGISTPSMPLRSRSARAAMGLIRTCVVLARSGHVMLPIRSAISGYGVWKFLAFGPSQ